MDSDEQDQLANAEPFSNFHHPYAPYDVQLEFMRTAYGVLKQGDGQIGILESPTGTGKSLSLICSAMTWLRDHKKEQHGASLEVSRDAMQGEPDWMVDQVLRRKRDELSQQWKDREANLNKIRAKEKLAEARGSKRRKVDEVPSKANNQVLDEDTSFLVGDWTRDNQLVAEADSTFSNETLSLLKKAGLSAPVKEILEDEPTDAIKIFYTSRTHSQLSQFISELRRPMFPPSIPPSVMDIVQDGSDSIKEVVKHIPLSSRQRLCINPSVSKLGSVSAINDRCAELQQPRVKNKCPFLPSSENLSSTHQFRDAALATLPDIEDLFRLGKSMQICPYYASRVAIPGAEIVTLPYPLLLQQSARDALGIDLRGSVVIIDEAHNIMDAIANVHAAEIRLHELRLARQMLGVYVKNFGKKLKGENRAMIAQVVRVIDALVAWLEDNLIGKGDHGIVDPNQLLKGKAADQVNIYTLIRYIHESKLPYKVESYADFMAASQEASSTPVLHNLVSFLSALNNLAAEGRVFYHRLHGSPPDIKLSYLLLSPTHAFSPIVAETRAVILAGGTMSPFDDYKKHLFPSLDPLKITTLSCGHVIPPDNICVWTLATMKPLTASVSSAPDVDSFEFSFQKRSGTAMIYQLGQTLLNICSVVPDGVVVFFPSYGYLDEVIDVWQQKNPLGGIGEERALWDRLKSKKSVFHETKGGSSEEVLKRYSAAILEESNPSTFLTGKASTPVRGALLLSVVGGKMSEGINFSDRLGRCVIIVGLPYPNINSPEWKARIDYIESSTTDRLCAESIVSKSVAEAMAKQDGRDYYENACMRAVNQSIGRAIRHRNDYAAIVLVDRRFGTERIRSKLPGWIRGGMVAGSEERGLQGLMGALNGFFRGKPR